jgi:Transposase DDE domain
MCPFRKYPVLRSLLSPFRLSQQKTLALFIASIAEVAQAASLQLASHLALQLGIRLDSALNRFYRLLRNPRIDDQKLTSQLLRLVVQGKHSVLIAIDWTAWHEPWQMILASVVVGCRAIPVHNKIISLTLMERSQNKEENEFLKSVVLILREIGTVAILLCDRGFRRVSWIKLIKELKQHFVVRLVADVMVYKSGVCRKLRQWHLGVGQVVDLGEVWVRQDRAVKTRVIGLWARGQKEPWWLATDSEDSIADVVALYDRRMAIEQQIRDTKGCRFGVKLEWTQFKKPQYLSRFVLLVAVALVLWTTIGQAVSEQNPGVRLPCKRKGPRLSLLRVGVRFLEKVSRMIHIGVRFVRSHLPPPALRIFGWIQTTKEKA